MAPPPTSPHTSMSTPTFLRLYPFLAKFLIERGITSNLEVGGGGLWWTLLKSGGFKYKTRLKHKIHYPFKWIQLNGNGKIGYCILKNLTIFKVGRVQLSSDFLLLLWLIAIVIIATQKIWTCFLKIIYQKWEYYREEKQDFERLLIFLNIKVSAKSNKIELCEEFLAM